MAKTFKFRYPKWAKPEELAKPCSEAYKYFVVKLMKYCAEQDLALTPILKSFVGDIVVARRMLTELKNRRLPDLTGLGKLEFIPDDIIVWLQWHKVNTEGFGLNNARSSNYDIAMELLNTPEPQVDLEEGWDITVDLEAKMNRTVKKGKDYWLQRALLVEAMNDVALERSEGLWRL